MSCECQVTGHVTLVTFSLQSNIFQLLSGTIPVQDIRDFRTSPQCPETLSYRT